MTLNDRQFRQQRLFNPLSVPRKQPHQMGLDEFAASPHTWWHNSKSENFSDIRDANRRGEHMKPVGSDYTDDEYEVDPGFHVGTLAAADARTGMRGADGTPVTFHHPVRINAMMGNSPRRPDTDMGEDWDEEHHDRFYRNLYEDRGSISAILSSPHDVSTYGDYAADAAREKGRILGGEAQHRLDTGNLSFPSMQTRVFKTDEPTGSWNRPPEWGGGTQQTFRHDIKYRDPRFSPATEMWGGPDEASRGEQQRLPLQGKQFGP